MFIVSLFFHNTSALGVVVVRSDSYFLFIFISRTAIDNTVIIPFDWLKLYKLMLCKTIELLVL